MKCGNFRISVIVGTDECGRVSEPSNSALQRAVAYFRTYAVDSEDLDLLISIGKSLEGLWSVAYARNGHAAFSQSIWPNSVVLHAGESFMPEEMYSSGQMVIEWEVPMALASHPV